MDTLSARKALADPRRPTLRVLWVGPPPGLTAAVVLIGSSLGLGALAAVDTELAGTAAAIVLVGLLMAIRPVYLAVTAIGLIFLVRRLGPGGAISMSDALIAAAGLLAVPALAGRPELRRLSPALRSFAAYLALLLPSLAFNHAVRGDLEAVHRVILVAGSLLTGAWVMHERKTTLALLLLLLVAAFFAVATIATSVTTGFAPAYPLGFHKNFVGSVMATTLLALLIAPSQFAVGARFRWGSLLLLATGVLAAQSRGGMLAAALGILIWVLRRSHEASTRTKVIGAVLGIGLSYFAYVSVGEQLSAKATLNTSSIGQRYTVEARTQEIWRTSPVIGVGLRYFNAGTWGRDAQAANNAIDNELAESGVIGLAGFVILHLGLAWALFRRKSALATAGLAVVLGHLLHGMVDIYWSAGVSALPMIIAGMGLAEAPAAHPKVGTG